MAFVVEVIFSTYLCFMKVVFYTRVSTEAQDVERQNADLLEYSKSKKYEVVRIFTEIISGARTRKQRPEMTNLLKYIEENKDINGVLVTELSRLGRNTLDVLDILGKLATKKVWVYSLSNNLCTHNEDGTENPTTKLTLTLLSGISTLERETIKDRSESGIRKAIGEGKWLGGKYLPYGYYREDKKLKIDDVEKEIIELIFELYLNGNGTKKIANELNRRLIPTRYNKCVTKPIKINGFEKLGKDFKWKDGTVYSILTNPTYIGKKIGKGLIEGKYLSSPKIIDEEIFLKVQHLLKTSVKPKKKKFFYLFDNQLKCGVCGLSYHPHKRLNNKDNRFICLSKRYNNSCNNHGISIPKLNDAVWSLLRHSEKELKIILESNSNRDEIESELKKNLENRIILHKELKSIESRESKLVMLLLDGNIDRKIYDEQFHKLKNQKVNQKGLIDVIDSEIASQKFILEKQNDVNRQLRNIKDDRNLLKKAIKNVVETIKIYPVQDNEFIEKKNPQDKFVYVEVLTYANKTNPLKFCISQRSNMILFPENVDYDKPTNCFIPKIIEEEEEGGYFVSKTLYHLTCLD